jgi:hypothetical protein
MVRPLCKMEMVNCPRSLSLEMNKKEDTSVILVDVSFISWQKKMKYV